MGKGIQRAREHPFQSVVVKDYPLSQLRKGGPAAYPDIRDVQAWVVRRVVQNVCETGNPMHHLAATGVVVDRDSTLENAIARLESENGTEVVPAIEDYYMQHPELLVPGKLPPIEVVRPREGEPLRTFYYWQAVRQIEEAAEAADATAELID